MLRCLEKKLEIKMHSILQGKKLFNQINPSNLNDLVGQR